MYDLELIQVYYSQMSDEQLKAFAKTDARKISGEALDILYEEFAKRGFNISQLDEVIEVKNQDKAAAEMTIANWDLAFSEKKSGVADTEILEGLRARGMNNKDASLLVQRLPDTQHEHEAFYDLIYKKSQGTSLEGVVGVILIGLGAYLIYIGVTTELPLGIVLGIGMVIGSFFIMKNSGGRKGDNDWTRLIKTQPEHIVWIKPIITKHTVGYVITLFKEHKFQIHTKDERTILITIDNDNERLVFFEGVKHFLPHVHIGYSYEINNLYAASPENFIGTLQEKGLYTPIDRFNLERPEAGS
jgi:hypothetical protein